MLLAVDIGNTNIVIGAFAGERLVASWRAATVADRTADEYAVLVQGFLTRRSMTVDQVQGLCVSSVVPSLVTTFRELAEKHLDAPAVVVNARGANTLHLRADNPGEVGADRIVNALAAAELHSTPAIVVDFGTATTFDAVSADRELLGSAIAPGLLTAMEGLVSRAARLFAVELIPPAQAIGTNTVASVQSGAMFGYVGLVEGLVRRFRNEMSGSPMVIATGGLAPVIAPLTTVVDRIDLDLTLHGLRLYHALNHP
ncbi:MAG: type III pantothenate kinase [Chloroflexota bacterium]